MDPHPIACMEIWGGSEAFQGAASVPGHDVYVLSAPHKGDARGGDLYYASNCAAGLITRFILADIAGHGQSVGEIALELRALMRRHINNANQSELARELNRAFGEMGHDGRFATAILLTYFAPTDHMVVCNAGHPGPMRYRAAERRWTWLDDERVNEPEAIGIANLPLGILDSTAFEQFAVHLRPGDMIALYTDALVEACNASGAPLGQAGLIEIANTIPVETGGESFASRLMDAVRAYAGHEAFDDDATVIVLHHNASNPPGLSLVGHVKRLAHAMGMGGRFTTPGQA